MKSRSPLKQDLTWCPEGTPAKSMDTVSFQGPFCFITPCLEKTDRDRKDRWCLMFITGDSMIITPVSLEHYKQIRKATGLPGNKNRHNLPRTTGSTVTAILRCSNDWTISCASTGMPIRVKYLWQTMMQK